MLDKYCPRCRRPNSDGKLCDKCKREIGPFMTGELNE